MFKIFSSSVKICTRSTLFSRSTTNSIVNFNKLNHLSTSLPPISASEPIVLVSDDTDTGVRRITLNNPKKRNALSLAMIEQLYQHLEDRDGKLRVIVINASAGKVFSSGHDLKELASLDLANSRKLFDLCGEMMLTIRRLPIPVICQVDGLAAAAGCQLVASCDIVLATERSHFSTPGADVGVFCSTPGIAVARSANLKMAAYMVLTGRSITAQEALASGLITRVVSDLQLESETGAILQSILAKSRTIIAHGKQFFYQQIEQNIETAYRNGSCAMVDNLKLKDSQEGIDAFVNKRKANWSHSE